MDIGNEKVLVEIYSVCLRDFSSTFWWNFELCLLLRRFYIEHKF
jgi:hypothetical protein